MSRPPVRQVKEEAARIGATADIPAALWAVFVIRPLGGCNLHATYGSAAEANSAARAIERLGNTTRVEMYVVRKYQSPLERSREGVT